MTIPRYQKGIPLKAADLNLLSDAVARARVLPGVGIKLTETVNGTVISLKPTRSGGGSSAPATENRPWDIINFTGTGQPDEEGVYPTYTGQIWPGTVNGLLPTNFFTQSGDLQNFSVTSGLTKWKCRMMTNGYQIVEAEIIVDTADIPEQIQIPSALPAQAFFIFALTYKGKIFRTLGPGNPHIRLNHNVTIPKTTPTPAGVPAVDRYYNIMVT